MALSLITRAGDSLQADGQTWRARGVNMEDLLDSNPDDYTQRLTELAGMGVNSVRTWGFGKNGRMEDARLKKLDAILDLCDRLGIRLLISLANNWTDWGGANKWQWNGKTLDQDSWFRPGTPTGLLPEWVDQVQRIVSRYRGRGTILAWEIMNEARPNNDPVSMAWMGKAAKMVKGFDPTHLVASGSEGALPGLYSFPSNQQDGLNPDLNVQALNPPEVDVVTHHAYSKYQAQNYDAAEWVVAATLAGVAAAAGGRPVLIGECGHDTDDPTPLEGPRIRRDYVTNVSRWSGKIGLSGGFLWAWGRPPSHDFTLSRSSPEDIALVKLWAKNL